MDPKRVLQKAHFIDILEIFRVDMSCNVLEKAFPTWQHTFLRRALRHVVFAQAFMRRNLFSVFLSFFFLLFLSFYCSD